jgi:Flp pilus assembly protein TadD
MKSQFHQIPKSKVTAVSPNAKNVQALFQQGIAFHQKGQLGQAKEFYEQALKLNAVHFDSLHMLGVIAGQTKDNLRAVDLIGKAIELCPNNAVFHSHRGNALLGLMHLDAAIASYDRAIAIKPDYAEAHYNRGTALQELRQLDAAIASYDRAIAIKPEYAAAYWNKGFALLLSGDYERGWALYEWRWKNEKLGNKQRHFPQPLWLGSENIKDKTILLIHEQGLGDTIQFCRYAKLVADLGARVVAEVPKTLLGALQGLEGVSEFAEAGKPLPAFDYHCPLASLPLAFKTTLDTIPASDSYLRSNSNKAAAWAARLGAKTKPRVGLVWSGSTIHTNDHNRSLTLQSLLPYLPATVDYISLQKELRDIDKAALQHSKIQHFGDELKDFTDTAALCELTDVVISVDTSVAHLAGSLGKKTWVLLPYVPDWRWLLDRDDSPWYPSARLYRQKTRGDWAEVLAQVRRDLAALAPQ